MAKAIRFFSSLSLSLLPSFISGSVGSYYPSWNDFNRDTAIPRELPPLCNSIHSHGQLVSQWFIEIFSLRVSLTPTTLGILLQHLHYSGCLSQVRTRQPGPDHQCSPDVSLYYDVWWVHGRPRLKRQSRAEEHFLSCDLSAFSFLKPSGMVYISRGRHRDKSSP